MTSTSTPTLSDFVPADLDAARWDRLEPRIGIEQHGDPPGARPVGDSGRGLPQQRLRSHGIQLELVAGKQPEGALDQTLDPARQLQDPLQVLAVSVAGAELLFDGSDQDGERVADRVRHPPGQILPRAQPAHVIERTVHPLQAPRGDLELPRALLELLLERGDQGAALALHQPVDRDVLNRRVEVGGPRLRYAAATQRLAQPADVTALGDDAELLLAVAPRPLENLAHALREGTEVLGLDEAA